MATLTVTSQGQVTLKKDVLRHIGIHPGDRLEYDKLPGGELRLRVARPAGSIKSFIGLLADGTSSGKKALSIEEMNDIAAAGWAGEK